VNFSFLSGGFLLIAIAAVWLFIFVPGVSQRVEVRRRPANAPRVKTQRTFKTLKKQNVKGASSASRVSQSQVAAAIAAITAESLVTKGQQENANSMKPSERAWTPNEIPSQLFQSQVGTIASTRIAEVINFSESATRRDANNNEIEQISTETASINLDEILRRRRANG
jgi:hypothetical protein